MRFVTVLCLLLSCFSSGPPPSPHPGGVAPPISSTQLGGSAFKLSEHRGVPVALVFWASWCGPCRQEVPHLTELVKQYEGRVRFFSVNAGETAPVAVRAAASWGITWPVVFDLDARIQADYAVEAIPLLVIVDGEGVVRSRGLGLPPDITQVLDGLL
ncbi:MAG: thiol-disulfide isomerase/thioredoxin [Myxococcota bacterium]|jgi:thiol-disulfide isomerase/thioredoxin